MFVVCAFYTGAAMLAFRFRAFALLAFGAMAVHQLRYAIAGSDTAVAAAHAYLHAAVPGVVILALLAGGHLLARLRHARTSRAAEPATWGLRRLWPAATLVLVLAYLMQEWTEAGAVGSPNALLAPVAHGGWVAVALAIVAGGVIALLLRGAGAVLAWAARGGALRSHPARPSRAIRPPARLHGATANPLASYLAGRAPPAVGV